jgi:hypothetical protein
VLLFVIETLLAFVAVILVVELNAFPLHEAAVVAELANPVRLPIKFAQFKVAVLGMKVNFVDDVDSD